MVGCAVFALPPAICADDGRFLDQLLGSSCCGGVQSCLSQLFLHYPIFQNHKQGFDLQSKTPPPWQNGIDGLGQGAKIYSL